MPDYDPYSIQLADEPTALEMAKARAAALRGQNYAGMIASLAHDPSLAHTGNAMINQAQTGLQELGQTPGERMRQLLQRQQADKAQRLNSAETSPAGIAFKRALAGQFVPGLDVSQAPPEVLQENMGNLEKIATTRESAAARLEQAKLTAALMGNRFNVTTGLKEDQFKAKRLKEMTDALNPLLPRGGLKNYADTIARAQKLTALIVDPTTGQPKTLLTPQDMTETAMALQQMVGAGHASQGQVEELTPKSIWGDAARTAQYITGHPWNAKQQEWAIRMLHSAQREAETNQNTILRSVQSKLPQFRDVREKYPDDYSSTLLGAGFDPEAFDTRGLAAPGATVTTGTNPLLSGDVTGGGHGKTGKKKVYNPATGQIEEK